MLAPEGRQEHMDTIYFLFAAYSATWIVLFVYLVSMWKKQERIEKGLQQLEEQLRRK